MHPPGLKTRLHTAPVLFAALLWGVLEWAALSRVRWRGRIGRAQRSAGA